MTLFFEILSGCGLSQRSATDFLHTRVDTLKSWSAGRNTPPPGVMRELHDLAGRQARAAQETFKVWKNAGKPTEIEIGIPADDYEARSLGWPCIGAHMAVIRRLWEMLPPTVKIIIVSRGATIAAAMEARDGRSPK